MSTSHTRSDKSSAAKSSSMTPNHNDNDDYNHSMMDGRNHSSSTDHSSLFSSGVCMDDSKVIVFKTVPCKKYQKSGNCPFLDHCDFAHGPEDLRRNITKHYYKPIRCKSGSGRDCPYGVDCGYSHNDNESLYHPDVYKVKLCDFYSGANGATCCVKGEFCSFAHGTAELRTSGSWSKRHTLSSNDEAKQSDSSHHHNNGFVKADKSNRRDGSAYWSSKGDADATRSPAVPASSIPPSSPSRTEGIVANNINASDVNAFRRNLEQHKVQILDVVDQIVRSSFDRAFYEGKQAASDESKSYRVDQNKTRSSIDQSSDDILSVHINNDSCGWEDLIRLEERLKQELEIVVQAKKNRFGH